MRFTALLLTLAAVTSATPRVIPDETGSDRALIAAVRKGELMLVKQLLTHGASANAKDSDGTPVIMLATMYSSWQAVQWLLDHGADPNTANAEGTTALHWAAGDIRKAQPLILAGANVNAASKFGRTPLLIAARQESGYPVVKLLLDKGARIDARDPVPAFHTGGGNGTALIAAAHARDGQSLRLLIERGADVNAKDTAGGTALLAAAWDGNLENVKALIAHGAEVNVPVHEFPFKGFTPLHVAASLNHPEIVATLLAHGADVNGKDQAGYTPLVWASMNDRAETAVVRALIDAGADVNVKGAFDETPLGYASKRGNTAIVEMLKKAGAR